MRQERLSDDAVSPVIGVMLMLVVTIIIAAIVSSFAGGLGSSTEAAPTVAFTVDYSKSNGLLLTCDSASEGLKFGDDFDVVVSTLGENPAYQEINASKFDTGLGDQFKAGDSIFINKTNLESALAEYSPDGTNSGYGYWITAADRHNIEGSAFTVKLISDRYGTIGTAKGIVKG
jgi:hypothetical protein